MLDQFIAPIVGAVIVAVLSEFRVYRVRKRWAKFTRQVVDGVNIFYDADNPKPVRILNLMFDGFVIINENETDSELH